MPPPHISTIVTVYYYGVSLIIASIYGACYEYTSYYALLSQLLQGVVFIYDETLPNLL